MAIRIMARVLLPPCLIGASVELIPGGAKTFLWPLCDRVGGGETGHQVRRR